MLVEETRRKMPWWQPPQPKEATWAEGLVGGGEDSGAWSERADSDKIYGHSTLNRGSRAKWGFGREMHLADGMAAIRDGEEKGAWW